MSGGVGEGVGEVPGGGTWFQWGDLSGDCLGTGRIKTWDFSSENASDFSKKETREARCEGKGGIWQRRGGESEKKDGEVKGGGGWDLAGQGPKATAI